MTINHTNLMIFLRERAETEHAECWKAIEKAEQVNREVDDMLHNGKLRDLDRLGLPQTNKGVTP